MTAAWIIAGIALLAAGILGGLLLGARARLRTLETESQTLRQSHHTELQREHVIRDGLFAAIDDALLVLADNHNILFSNASANEMIGQNATGETLIAALRHPELETLISDAQMLNGDSVERRVELDRHVLRARALAVNEDDDSFAILTLRDVTELQQLERARREMVSNVTHELSHPITAIGLLADTLLNVATKEKPKRIRKMARDIRREADTLTQLVQEMRDLSLIESGQMPIRLMTAGLAPIVNATIEQLQSLADNKNQTVEVELDDDINVLADEVQIQRVLKNILHNAIKFSPDDSPIHISAQQADSDVTVMIRDNGPGIPEEDIPRIFERFFQVDRARRDGTGLGLAIVRHIVRAHGGQVWTESTEGHGATFFITLALADDVRDNAASGSDADDAGDDKQANTANDD